MKEDNSKNPPQKKDSEGESESQESLAARANSEFAHVFEEMVDIMQFAVQNSVEDIKFPLPKDIEERLAKLESDVDLFCRLNEAIANSKKLKSEAQISPT